MNYRISEGREIHISYFIICLYKDGGYWIRTNGLYSVNIMPRLYAIDI